MPMAQWDPFMYWSVADGGAQFESDAGLQERALQGRHPGHYCDPQARLPTAAVQQQQKGLHPTSEADRRSALVRQAFRLEYITAGWIVVEADAAIGSGIAARRLEAGQWASAIAAECLAFTRRSGL
jgi:hypothetical protein